MWRNLLALVCLLTIASVASAAGLEVHLPLDGNVNDYSGNGNNGVLVDGAAGTNAWTTGVVNQGLDIGLTAGNNEANAEATKTNGDYVSIDYTLTDAGTISLWYQKSDFDYNYEAVWDNSGTSAHPGDNWECWIDQWGPGHLYARSPDGSDGRWSDEVNRAVQTDLNNRAGGYLGEWLHIAVTWNKLDATTMEMNMYLDGVLVDTSPAMTWQAPGDTFYLGGGHDDNTYGIGAFDELGIWSRELTAAQVQNVYANGVPEPSTIVLLLIGAVTILLHRRNR